MPRNCFGEEELTYLQEVIESQDAWRWGRSNFVPRFEEALENISVGNMSTP